MAQATTQTVIAVAIGLILAATLSSLLSRRIHLPDDWRRALPLLETRINAYVPTTLKTLRLLLLITVSLVVLDAWRAVALPAWLESARGRATIALVFRSEAHTSELQPLMRISYAFFCLNKKITTKLNHFT